jgi:hypothetical protein
VTFYERYGGLPDQRPIDQYTCRAEFVRRGHAAAAYAHVAIPLNNNARGYQKEEHKSKQQRCFASSGGRWL